MPEQEPAIPNGLDTTGAYASHLLEGISIEEHNGPSALDGARVRFNSMIEQGVPYPLALGALREAKYIFEQIEGIN